MECQKLDKLKLEAVEKNRFFVLSARVEAYKRGGFCRHRKGFISANLRPQANLASVQELTPVLFISCDRTLRVLLFNCQLSVSPKTYQYLSLFAI